jgi:hypothetical protein
LEVNTNPKLTKDQAFAQALKKIGAKNTFGNQQRIK